MRQEWLRGNCRYCRFCSGTRKGKELHLSYVCFICCSVYMFVSFWLLCCGLVKFVLFPSTPFFVHAILVADSQH